MHIMFHTRTTAVKIKHDDLPRLFQYFAGTIRGLGGISIAVGGIEDHVHILVSIPKMMLVSDFVKTLKIRTNIWLKSLDARYDKFSWQDGYGAFSVSASVLPKIRNYIMNQEEHHKKVSYIDEYRTWLDAYGIEYDERYAFTD